VNGGASARKQVDNGEREVVLQCILRGLIDDEGERLHKKRANVDALVVLSDKVRQAFRHFDRIAIKKLQAELKSKAARAGK
jgi:hypothetical protein